jgi:hypothetical protein
LQLISYTSAAIHTVIVESVEDVFAGTYNEILLAGDAKLDVAAGIRCGEEEVDFGRES